MSNPKVDAVLEQLQKTIYGKDRQCRLALGTLLARGNLLIEDVPGVGKTTLALGLSRALALSFGRIQFTPDTLPGDITGYSTVNMHTGELVFHDGPVMNHIILADEINRTSPKTQASLLEVMEEQHVTVEGKTTPVPQPFMVIATENPIEFSGTYQLPEAQLDRFLMRLTMGYPDPETEKRILESHVEDNPLTSLKPVLEASDLLHCQALVRTVYVSPQFRDYLVTLINKTRNHPAFAFGCSPRATLALLRASQALAAMKGRDHVMPRDARDLAVFVLAHRMPLRLQSRSEWSTSAKALEDILSQMPMSRWES